jgi:hypothetical protein
MERIQTRDAAGRGAERAPESLGARPSGAACPTRHEQSLDGLLGVAGGSEQGAGARLEPAAPTIDAPADMADARRTWVRMALIEQYHLTSAFIAVPKLAAIMGFSASTIWNHMRQRKFPIPYRMINTTPMVCIDDLVDWYCARDDLIFPNDAEEPPKPRAAPRDEAAEERRRRAAETDAIVDEALAKLGMAPRRRRRHG